MNSYYSDIVAQNRYSAYAIDGLDYSSQKELAASIWKAMNGFATDWPIFGLHNLAGDSTKEERHAYCRALAGYLLARSR